MHTRDRAIGAASSREGADRLQHRTDQELGARDSRGKKHEVDFGEYRQHADEIAPKYAGKRTLPIVHHEIPKMDPKVGSLMHELGEAHKKRAAHLTQHAQLKAQGKAATSQLAARPSPSRLPGEEMAVQQEIAAAKKAVRTSLSLALSLSLSLSRSNSSYRYIIPGSPSAERGQKTYYKYQDPRLRTPKPFKPPISPH